MRVRIKVGWVSYISVLRSDVDVNLVKLKVVQMGRMQAIKFNTKSRQGLKSVENELAAEMTRNLDRFVLRVDVDKSQ